MGPLSLALALLRLEYNLRLHFIRCTLVIPDLFFEITLLWDEIAAGTQPTFHASFSRNFVLHDDFIKLFLVTSLLIDDSLLGHVV